MQNHRDIPIDICKGIAIFCVVAGHVFSGFIPKMIFLFHIPFFFIISGYLHKPEPDAWKYFKSKAASLLVPYAVYLLIFKIPALAMQIGALFASPDMSHAKILGKTIAKIGYGGAYLVGNEGIFWFITCLFLTQQLYNFLRIHLDQNRVMGIAVFLYFLSMLHQFFFGNFIFPWAVNIVGVSILFYCIGALWDDSILKNRNIGLLITSFFIAAIAVFLVFMKQELSLDMKNSYYGWLGISPFIAIAFSVVIAKVSNLLSNLPWLKNPLAFSGVASITVMYTHQFLHLQIFHHYAQEWPFCISVLIFLIGCGLHFVFSKNRMARAFLIGSRNELAILFQRGFGK